MIGCIGDQRETYFERSYTVPFAGVYRVEVYSLDESRIIPIDGFEAVKVEAGQVITIRLNVNLPTRLMLFVDHTWGEITRS